MFNWQACCSKVPSDVYAIKLLHPLDEAVYQNLALADDLDVPSNIFLGQEKIYFNLGPFSFLNEKKMFQKFL